MVLFCADAVSHARRRAPSIWAEGSDVVWDFHKAFAHLRQDPLLLGGQKGAAAGGETQGGGLSPAAAAQLPCLLDVAAPKSSDEELLRDLGELAVAPP